MSISQKNDFRHATCAHATCLILVVGTCWVDMAVVSQDLLPSRTLLNISISYMLLLLSTSTGCRKEFHSVPQHLRGENEAPVTYTREITASPGTSGIIPQAVFQRQSHREYPVVVWRRRLIATNYSFPGDDSTLRNVNTKLAAKLELCQLLWQTSYLGMSTYIDTYVRKYVRKRDLPTYLHTYIHTYIHTILLQQRWLACGPNPSLCLQT